MPHHYSRDPFRIAFFGLPDPAVSPEGDGEPRRPFPPGPDHFGQRPPAVLSPQDRARLLSLNDQVPSRSEMLDQQELTDAEKNMLGLIALLVEGDRPGGQLLSKEPLGIGALDALQDRRIGKVGQTIMSLGALPEQEEETLRGQLDRTWSGRIARTGDAVAETAGWSALGLIEGMTRSALKTIGVDKTTSKEIFGPAGRAPIPDNEIDALDVTIPMTAEQLESLSPATRNLRRINFMFDAIERWNVNPLKGAVIHTTGEKDRFSWQDPITLAGARYQGAVARPSDDAENLMQWVGEFLAPAIPLAAISIPAYMGRAALASRIPAWGGGLARAANIGNELRSAATAATARAALQRTFPYAATSGMAVEGAIGAGFGSGYEALSAFESGLDSDTIHEHAVRGALWGGLAGLGLGGLFSLPHNGRLIRKIRALNRMADDNIRVGPFDPASPFSIKPGESIYHDANRNIVLAGFDKRSGRPLFVERTEAGGFRFLRKEDYPTHQQIYDRVMEKISGFAKNAGDDQILSMSLAGATPLDEALRAKMNSTAAGAPPTPEVVEVALSNNRVVTHYELAYDQAARSMVLDLSDEALVAQIKDLRDAAMQISPEQPLHMALKGRARALERYRALGVRTSTGKVIKPPVAGATTPEQLTGIGPFEIEQAARNLLLDADLDDHALAVMLKYYEVPFEYKTRARQIHDLLMSKAIREQLLLTRGIKNRPNSFQDVISEMMTEYGRLRGRGITQATEVILPDGQLGVPLKAPKHGRLDVRVGNTVVRNVAAADVLPVPKVGKYVQLRDGTIGQVIKLSDTIGPNSRVTVKLPSGETKMFTLKAVEQIGNSDIINARLARMFTREAETVGQTVSPTPSAPPAAASAAAPEATTPSPYAGLRVVNRETGEVLETVGRRPGGQTAVKEVGSSKNKKQRYVPSEKLGVSSREVVNQVASGDLSFRAIGVFEPGTTPPKGWNITFMGAKEGSGPNPGVALRAAMADAGEDHMTPDFMARLHETLGWNSTILPQKPEAGGPLYAVLSREGSKFKKGGKNRNRLLEILKEKKDGPTAADLNAGHLKSQVTLTPEGWADAKIFEVPEALVQQLKTVDEILALSPAERMEYIKAASSMSFHGSPINTEARAKAGQAAEKIINARALGHPDDEAKAVTDLLDVGPEAYQKHLVEDYGRISEIEDELAGRLMATTPTADSDPVILAAMGDDDAMKTVLREWPVADGTTDYKPLVLPGNNNNPDTRLVIRKEPLSRVDEATGQPMPGVQYRLALMDGNHLIGEQLISPINSRIAQAIPVERVIDPKPGEILVTQDGKFLRVEDRIRTPRGPSRKMVKEIVEETEGNLLTNDRTKQLVRQMQRYESEGFTLEELRAIEAPKEVSSLVPESQAAEALSAAKKRYQNIQKFLKAFDEMTPDEESAFLLATRMAEEGVGPYREAIRLTEVETGRTVRPSKEHSKGTTQESQFHPLIDLDEELGLSRVQVYDEWLESSGIRGFDKTKAAEAMTPDEEFAASLPDALTGADMEADFLERLPWFSVEVYRPHKSFQDPRMFNRPLNEEQLAALRKQLQAAKNFKKGDDLLEINIPVRVVQTEEQVMARVMNATKDFQFRTGTFLNGGEYQGILPGIYATIQNDLRTGEAVVKFWKKNRANQDPRSILVDHELPDGSFTGSKRFPSKQEAEIWLEESMAMSRPAEFMEPRPSAKIAELISTYRDRLDALNAHMPREGLTAEAIMGTPTPEGFSGGISAGKNGTLRALKSNITKSYKAMLAEAERLGYGSEEIARLVSFDPKAPTDWEPVMGRGGFRPASVDQRPLIDTLEPHELERVQRDLLSEYKFYRENNNGYLPPEFKNYAARFAMKWDETFEGTTKVFNGSMRRSLGTLYPDDLYRAQKYAHGLDIPDDISSSSPEYLNAVYTRLFRTDLRTEGFFPGGAIGAERYGRPAGDLAIDAPRNPVRQLASAMDMDGHGNFTDYILLGKQRNKVSPEQVEVVRRKLKLDRDLARTSDAAYRTRTMHAVDDALSSIEGFQVARVANADGSYSLGRVLDIDLESGAAKIHFPGGEIETIAPDTYTLARVSGGKFDWLKAADLQTSRPVVVDGIMAPGTHPVDKRLGTMRMPAESAEGPLGQREMDTIGKIAVRARQRLDEIFGPADPLKEPTQPARIVFAKEFQGKGQTRSTKKRYEYFDRLDPDALRETLELANRLGELGGYKLQNLVIDRIPEKLQGAFRLKLEEQIAESFGPNNPLGRIAARIRAGNSSKQELKTLGELAKMFGIKNDNPIVQIDNLLGIGAIDPKIARQMVGLNKEAGLGAFLMKEDIIKDHFTLKIVGEPYFSTPHAGPWFFSSTEHMANKHPTLRMWVNLGNASQAREAMAVDSWKDLLGTIKDYYGHHTQIAKHTKIASDLLDEFSHRTTWDAIKKAKPDVPDDARFAFETLRDHLDQMLSKSRISAIRNGQNYVPFDPAKHLDWAKREYGATSMDDLPKFIQDTDNLWLIDDKKPQTNLVSKDVAVRFDNILKRYASLQDVPEEVLAGLPENLLQSFDAWKNWGLDNYWPYVHRGATIVEKELADGAFETVIWGRSPGESVEILRKAIRSGDLDGGAAYRVRTKGYAIDDLMHNVIDRKRYSEIFKAIKNASDLSSEEVGALLHKQGMAPESARRALMHAKQRRADLRGMLEPLEEMEIYTMRVIRNEYLQDIDDIARWVNKMDESLSAAAGVRAMKDLPGGKENGLVKWFKASYALSKGERGPVEIRLDNIVGFYEWLKAAPKDIVQAAMAKRHGENLFVDVNGLPHRRAIDSYLGAGREMYTQPYAARTKANAIANVQSKLRLGGNPSAALVNLTQTLINVTPYVPHKTLFVAAKDLLSYTHAGQMGIRELDDATSNLLRRVLSETGVKHQPSIAGARTGGGQLYQQGHQVSRSSLARRHVRAKQTSTGELSDLFDYLLLGGFEAAERYNRALTAWGGYKAALGKGLNHDQSVEWARKLIEHTQFIYSDNALPLIMTGPLAKTLAQFKTYPIMQLRYEKDLIWNQIIKPLAEGNTAAAAQGMKMAATHYAWLGALGGLNFYAKHPFLTGFGSLAWVAGAAGWDAGEDALKGGVRIGRQKDHDWGSGPPDINNPMWQWEDAVTDGIPGLLGLSTTGRIGVTTTDLNFSNIGSGQLILGPHWSMTAAYTRFLMGQLAGMTGGEKLGTTMGALGGAYTTGAVSSILRGRAGAIPATVLVGSWLGAVLANQASGSGTLLPMSQDSPEGRRFVQAILPTMVRNWITSQISLWKDHGYTDSKGHILPIPPGPTLAHEHAASAIGFQTQYRAQFRGYQDMTRALDQERRAARQQYGHIIAQSFIDGNEKKAYDFMWRAMEKGVYFTQQEIDTIIQRKLDSAIASHNKSLMIPTRGEAQGR